MDTIRLDPDAPLPGPPDPWASTDTPTRRGTPPFHMTEMIATEPALAGRIVGRLADADSPAAQLASAITAALDGGRTVVVTGCGTSEHAAQAVAEIVREAVDPRRAASVVSAQAFELAQDAPSDGLVVGISHEGATTATNAALAAARSAGARTALVTVTRRSPGASLADIVVETGELDQSWCHTVGYVSPIAVATAVAGRLKGHAVSPDGAAALLLAGTAPGIAEEADAVAAALASLDRVIVIASGADRPAGRELVLKIEEGAWLPAAYRDLETFLHGHLAATDAATGLVAIATERRGREARVARTVGALAAAREIGMPTAAILTAWADERIPTASTSLGRLVIPDAPDDVPAAIGALLGSATALQTLTERLARARDVDPDAIHRDVERYRLAAEAAEG